MEERKEQIFAQRACGLGNDIELHYYQTGVSGTFVAKALVIEACDEAVYQPCFMRLTPTVAQELIDGLWQCGVRPSEGTGSAGSLAATERHLSDMRNIVAKKLAVDL